MCSFAKIPSAELLGQILMQYSQPLICININLLIDINTIIHIPSVSRLISILFEDPLNSRSKSCCIPNITIISLTNRIYVYSHHDVNISVVCLGRVRFKTYVNLKYNITLGKLGSCSITGACAINFDNYAHVNIFHSNVYCIYNCSWGPRPFYLLKSRYLSKIIHMSNRSPTGVIFINSQWGVNLQSMRRIHARVFKFREWICHRRILSV